MTDKINNLLLVLEIALILAGAVYVNYGETVLEEKGCSAYWNDVVPGVEVADNSFFAQNATSLSPEPESSSTGLRLNGS